MTALFYPNEIKTEDIASLSGWRLLVAVCHFGPTMGDCVALNYSYSLERPTKDSRIFEDAPDRLIIHCDGVPLHNDIDMADVFVALVKYAGFDWREWARERLRAIVSEQGRDPDGQKV